MLNGTVNEDAATILKAEQGVRWSEMMIVVPAVLRYLRIKCLIKFTIVMMYCPVNIEIEKDRVPNSTNTASLVIHRLMRRLPRSLTCLSVSTTICFT